MQFSKYKDKVVSFCFKRELLYVELLKYNLEFHSVRVNKIYVTSKISEINTVRKLIRKLAASNFIPNKFEHYFEKENQSTMCAQATPRIPAIRDRQTLKSTDAVKIFILVTSFQYERIKRECCIFAGQDLWNPVCWFIRSTAHRRTSNTGKTWLWIWQKHWYYLTYPLRLPTCHRSQDNCTDRRLICTPDYANSVLAMFKGLRIYTRGYCFIPIEIKHNLFLIASNSYTLKLY